jgi:hypothetical protein
MGLKKDDLRGIYLRPLARPIRLFSTRFFVLKRVALHFSAMLFRVWIAVCGA